MTRKHVVDGMFSVVDGRDLSVVGAALQNTIEHPPVSRSMVFPLTSGVSPNEVPDESSLLGFAQLTVLGVFPSDGTSPVEESSSSQPPPATQPEPIVSA